MKFEYNGITIGDGATGTGANTRIINKPRWSWSFAQVTWSVDFSKETTTEASMRSFDQAIRNVSSGLVKISGDFTITYNDGTTDSFKEEPSAANPTGVNQNPVIEVLSDETMCETYQRYRFTLTFDLPTAFNGVTVFQASVSHDVLGYQMVEVSGLMPSQYLNSSHDALQTFDAFFTSRVEKAVLGTFLGKDYYKRISGPNLTSEKGLGAISDASTGKWKQVNFSAVYKQVAFSEEAGTFISTHLIMPMISVSQLPDASGELSLPNPSGSQAAPVAKNNQFKYMVLYETGVSLDSPILGGQDIKKAKKTGFQAKFGNMAQIYSQVVRLSIVQYLKDIFGDEVVLYNESVTYTNEPRIIVQALAMPARQNEVYIQDNFATNVTRAANFKLLDGKDYSMSRYYPGAVANCVFTRTVLSKDGNIPGVSTGQWKVDSEGISGARVAGAIYKSQSGGKITFAPLIEVTKTWNCTYVAEGSKENMIGSSGGSGGGGGSSNDPFSVSFGGTKLG